MRTQVPVIEIRALQAGEDTSAFSLLNEEWITSHFVLEEADRAVLSDPKARSWLVLAIS